MRWTACLPWTSLPTMFLCVTSAALAAFACFVPWVQVNIGLQSPTFSTSTLYLGASSDKVLAAAAAIGLIFNLIGAFRSRVLTESSALFKLLLLAGTRKFEKHCQSGSELSCHSAATELCSRRPISRFICHAPMLFYCIRRHWRHCCIWPFLELVLLSPGGTHRPVSAGALSKAAQRSSHHNLRLWILPRFAHWILHLAHVQHSVHVLLQGGSAAWRERARAHLRARRL
jgi:hypothetical protein